MSSSTKNFFGMIFMIVVGFFVIKWAIATAIGILITLVPLAIVGGAIYFAYKAFGPKSLGGGGRRTLL